MKLGEKFILAAIQEESVESILEVPESHFVGSEEKLLEFTKDYFTKYSKLPTLGVLDDKFLELTKVTGTAKYYKSELVNRYIYTSLGSGIPKIIKGLKEDPILSLEKLRGVISDLELSVIISEDMPYNESVMDRYKEYKKRLKTTDGVTYISTGDSLMDSITFGIRKNDLWTYGGRSGTKKTWWIVEFAIKCSQRLPDTLGPALLITNEIGLEEMGERIDAIRFKLGYKRLMSGKLSPIERKRYAFGAKRLTGKASKLVVIFNCSTLEDLRYKIRLYNPAVVFLDGSYLMEPYMEEGMKKTTFITRNLKAIAKDLNTPIINTTQLRKGTGKKASTDLLTGQDQFFYGSYIQDSDFAIAGYIEPDMMYRQEVGLDFVKARRIEHVQLIWASNLESMEFEYLLPREKEDTTVEVDEDI